MQDQIYIPKPLPKDVFPDQIRGVRKRDISPVRRIDINLALALNDQPYDIAGDFFYVWDTPDTGSYIEVKVNNNRESAAPYYQQTGQKVPFERLYITTPAGQTGNLILLYGTEWPDLVALIDNRAAVSQDIADLLNQLQGDTTPENWGELTIGVAQSQVVAANADRKSFSICADINNTGFIYLGFDNTVTTAAGGALWFHVLQPGGFWSIDDYRGPIHAISTMAGQLIGYAEV